MGTDGTQIGLLMGLGVLLGYAIGMISTWYAFKKLAMKKNLWDLLTSKEEK